jgi:aerobic carbon-monoxide dehydrogenase medium subunit
MFPADFAYARAGSLDEALDLLYEAREAGQEAKVIAGGQSLLPMMKLRLAAPEVLIDLSDIRQLKGGGWMGYANGDNFNGAIGALVTYRELQRYSRLLSAAPAIGDALAVLADPQVRARGTIGGAVAHGDPAADLPAVLLALDADVTIASRPGTRMRPRRTPPPTLGPLYERRRRQPSDAPRAETQTIPLDSFLQGVFTTDLAEDEILTYVGLRINDARGSAYEKFPHPASHLPLAGVAAIVKLSDGRVDNARIAVTGIAPRPYRARQAEELLAGAAPVPGALAAAAATVALDVHLLGDQHASADYRAHLAQVLTRRVLATAIARARDSGPATSGGGAVGTS